MIDNKIKISKSMFRGAKYKIKINPKKIVPIPIMKMKGKCQNCKENECYLQVITIKGKKKYWCDTCIDGYKNKDKDYEN